jgi:hypothetical protein
MDVCVEPAKVVQYVNNFFAWVRNGGIPYWVPWQLRH